MEAKDWSTFRGTCGAILYGLDQQTTLEFPAHELRTPLDFERYLAGLKFEADLRHTLDFTFDALKKAGQSLGAAHDLAAATVVPEPKPKVVKLMTDSLTTISNDLANEQRFQAIVEIAGAAAAALKSAQA